MKIRLVDRMPYVSASLTYQDRSLTLDQVLVDTGSGSSVFSADEMAQMGVLPEPDDRLFRIFGVGGSEYVFSRRLDRVALGEIAAPGLQVQIGLLDYGFPLQGILGMDFLLRARAVIDLGELEISSPGLL